MGTGQLTPGNGGDCRRGGTVAGKQVYYSLHNFYYTLSLPFHPRPFINGAHAIPARLFTHRPTNKHHSRPMLKHRPHNLSYRVCGNRSYHSRLGPMTAEI